MPLTILLPMVVLGILGIALLLHLAGLSARRRIAGEADARAEWQRHFADASVAEVIVAPDGLSALICDAQGAGLLRSFGADTVAHRITGASRQGGSLRVAFGEFGAPAARLRLPAEVLDIWEARIAGR